MKNFNYSGLDASMLQSLVMVYETGKVSEAAVQLNISQSTLSHRLEKARSIIGDSLFVRAGRKIIPTPRLIEIMPIAREILNNMQLIVEPIGRPYSELSDNFVIAATDYDRIVFLFNAYKRLHQIAPLVTLDFVWPISDTANALRDGIYDAVVSVLDEPDSSEIRQRILFSDEIVCFYDANCRAAPATMDEYFAANHLRVLFSKDDVSIIDKALVKANLSRKIALTLPSISEVPSILRGSNLVVTLPANLTNSIMHEFETCESPFPFETLTFKLYWHEQTHTSQKHAWLREQVLNEVKSLVSSHSNHLNETS